MIEKVDASRKNVRNFGFLFGAICVVAVGILLYKGNSHWLWAAGGAILFFAGALAGYPLLKPLYTVWMLFAFLLGWVNTRLLLGVFYYLVLTPIGLFLRLRGRDLLDRGFDRRTASYWIRRERRPFDPRRLERMF